MKSKRSHEGYLLIDNRHAACPAHPTREFAGAGAAVVEMPTLTCSHCQKQMIVNPLRTRERPYCRKCDHYLCDECALVAHLNGGECQPYQARLDQQQNRLLRTL